MKNYIFLLPKILTVLIILFGMIIISNSDTANNTYQNEIKTSVLKQAQSDIKTFIGGFSIDSNATPYYIGQKVSFIFIGGQFCPYCGMERWAVVLALENFGYFTNLTTITSSESSVPTYNFVGSSFNSSQVDFQPVEAYDNNRKPLETMNQAQSYFHAQYDSVSSIPFLCIGGSVFQVGSGSSLDLNSFSGEQFNAINNQIVAKSGTLYNQILTESNYIVQILNHFISAYNSSSLYSYNFSFNSSLTTTSPSFDVPLVFLSIFTIIMYRLKKNKKTL